MAYVSYSNGGETSAEKLVSGVVPLAAPPDKQPLNEPNSSGPSHKHRGVYELSILPWLWEIIALFLATGLMAAILTILVKADNMFQKKWPFRITPNTLVNILSTLYRTLLAAIAVEIVCQEKWVWFWSASSAVRPLSHMQYFENASRGLFGAVKLLPIVISRSLSTCLALLVIVLSLAIGPCVQQSISIDYDNTNSSMGRASLPVSHMLAGELHFRTLSSSDYGNYTLSPKAKSAMYNAFANPASNDTIIPVDCSTGNCTFSGSERGQPCDTEQGITHTTVGVCEKCYDVSSMISSSMISRSFVVMDPHEKTRYSLPNGVEITPSDLGPWLSVVSGDDFAWADPIIKPQMAAELRWSFVNATMLTMSLADGQDQTDPETRPTQPIAASCSLYPCMRDYSACVQDGQLDEKILNTTPLYPDIGDYTVSEAEDLFAGNRDIDATIFLSAVQSPCRHGNTIYTTSNISTAADATAVRLLSPDGAPSYPSIMAPEQCLIRMSNFHRLLLASFYTKHLLNSTCTWDDQQGSYASCRDAWWLEPFWQQKQASFQTINNRFSEIALAITNQFRLGLGRAPGTQPKVNGTALEWSGYTVFEWEWMLLPIFLLAIVAALLVATILRSVRHRGEEMAWKGNLLPLLYYRTLLIGTDDRSLESQDRFENIAGAGDSLMTATQLNQASRHIPVYLRKGDRRTSVASRSDISQDSLQEEGAGGISLRTLHVAG